MTDEDLDIYNNVRHLKDDQDTSFMFIRGTINQELNDLDITTFYNYKNNVDFGSMLIGSILDDQNIELKQSILASILTLCKSDEKDDMVIRFVNEVSKLKTEQ